MVRERFRKTSEKKGSSLRWPKAPMKTKRPRRVTDWDYEVVPLTEDERDELEGFVENVRDAGDEAREMLEFALGVEFCRRLLRQREGTSD